MNINIYKVGGGGMGCTGQWEWACGSPTGLTLYTDPHSQQRATWSTVGFNHMIWWDPAGEPVQPTYL